MIWIYLTLLILASIIDLRHRIIPNWLSGSLGVIGIVDAYYFSPGSDFWLGVTAAGLVFCALLAIAITSSGGIGGGDIKLATALSLPTGASGLDQLFNAWLVIAGCSLPVIFLAISGRISWQRTIPFAPCLAVGYLAGLM